MTENEQSAIIRPLFTQRRHSPKLGLKTWLRPKKQFDYLIYTHKFRVTHRSFEK